MPETVILYFETLLAPASRSQPERKPKRRGPHPHPPPDAAAHGTRRLRPRTRSPAAVTEPQKAAATPPPGRPQDRITADRARWRFTVRRAGRGGWLHAGQPNPRLHASPIPPYPHPYLKPSITDQNNGYRNPCCYHQGGSTSGCDGGYRGDDGDVLQYPDCGDRLIEHHRFLHFQFVKK